MKYYLPDMGPSNNAVSAGIAENAGNRPGNIEGGSALHKEKTLRVNPWHLSFPAISALPAFTAFYYV
jgi:hypothetical protein